MTLIEVIIGAVVLGIVGVAAVQTLLVFNRNAVSTRMMASAREIVQRNIEAVTAVPFTTTNVPANLAITSSSGVVWDDDGGGDNTVNLYTSRDGAITVVSGTLTRIVTAENNSVSADIRRVTFRINYSLFGRAMNYSITTLRSPDT